MKDILPDLKEIGLYALVLLAIMAATQQGVFEDNVLYEEVEFVAVEDKEVEEVEENTINSEPFLDPQVEKHHRSIMWPPIFRYGFLYVQ